MPRRARIGTNVWSGHVAVPGQVRPEQWPAVDADALPEARRTQFLRRKTGIVLYFNGASEAGIRAACGQYPHAWDTTSLENLDTPSVV